MDCINLRQRFGDKYRITYDEAYYHERPEFRATEEPHLQIIPCLRGHIYPTEGDTLAVFAPGGPTRRRLAELPGCRPCTDGSDGATFLFHVDHFEAVAEVVQPRRRRRCHSSPEHLQRLAEIGKANLARLRAASLQSDSTSAERDLTPQPDTLPVPAVRGVFEAV